MPNKQEITDHIITPASNRGIVALQAAVARMREAVQAAQWAIEEAETNGLDARVVGRVMHEFAWGYANATSSLGHALACVDDILKAERLAGEMG